MTVIEATKFDYKKWVVPQWQSEVMASLDKAITTTTASYQAVMAAIPAADVADVLERAADLLESGKVTWVKGKLYEKTAQGGTEVCAVGAVYVATGYLNGVHIQDTLRTRCELELDKRTPLMEGQQRSIVYYNDHVATDVSQVVDIMKATAKDLRNQPASFRSF